MRDRKLNLRQQRILSDVIAKAQKNPGLQTTVASNYWLYAAERSPIGTIRWRIEDPLGNLVMSGECS